MIGYRSWQTFRGDLCLPGQFKHLNGSCPIGRPYTRYGRPTLIGIYVLTVHYLGRRDSSSALLYVTLSILVDWIANIYDMASSS